MYDSFSTKCTVSKQKVEKVVYDPITPVDMVLIMYGCNFLGKLTFVVNQPKMKEPVKFIKRVPIGKPLPHISRAIADIKYLNKLPNIPPIPTKK